MRDLFTEQNMECCCGEPLFIVERVSLSWFMTHDYSQLLDDHYFSVALLTDHWWVPDSSLYLFIVKEYHLEKILSNQLFLLLKFNLKSDFLKDSFDVIYEFFILKIHLKLNFRRNSFETIYDFFLNVHIYIHPDIAAHDNFCWTEFVDSFDV